MPLTTDGVPKKRVNPGGMKKLQPSDFGYSLSKLPFNLRSPKTIAVCRKRAAMRKRATRLAVTKEIIAFYRPGWPGLLPAQKASRAAIVQALLRQGRVTATKSPAVIIEILESLASTGKIKLPPKTKSGRARQKKK